MAGNPYSNPYEDINGLNDKKHVSDIKLVSDKKHISDNRQKEKEKVKTAVALSYDPGDAAPKIIASGKGVLAERIIDTAQEAEVPIHKDVKLADTLSKLDIGDYIPPELYEVVAEILLFVDKIDNIMEKAVKKR